MCCLQEAGNSVAYLNHIFLDIVRQHIVDLILGEVNGRFNMGNHAEDLVTHRMDALRKVPRKMPRRHRQRCLRPRLDDIHDGLRLREVEPPVEESALRELAAFRRPCPRLPRELQRLAQRHESAVALQLHNILHRIRMRREHDEGQRLVDDLPLLIHDMAVDGMMAARQDERLAVLRLEDLAGRLQRMLPADADDADAALTLRCRDGTDRISLLHTVFPSFRSRVISSRSKQFRSQSF